MDADRRESGIVRTDRPDDATWRLLPSVREVLRMDSLGAGLPETIVGGAALDARVRWVHASDNPDVARLLEGGELLLTTGSEWPTDAAGLTALVDRLAAAHIAGIVLELGARVRETPVALANAAVEAGLALVVLHREVRFVTVTAAVHARIISQQMIALRARDEVRERFTAMALRGAPADLVVRQVARTLDAPVVLENLAHEVVFADVDPEREEEVLASWEQRARSRADSHLLAVPVEARGTRWGVLVAFEGPPHPAGRRSVVEQAAIALAIGRLAEGGTGEWERIGRARLLDDLLAGRYSSTGAARARLEAAGLPVRDRRVFAVVLTGSHLHDDDSSILDAAARQRSGRAWGAASATEIMALVSLPAGAWVDDSLAEALLSACDGRATGIAIGHGADDVDGALASLGEAIELARRPRGAARIRRVQDRPLSRLIGSLRDDYRLLAHGERMLAPLRDYDMRNDGDLIAVLTVALAHPGNRTAAASASHLSRSVFYQRLALIERLLGVDLNDGETQAALHIAVLTRPRPS